MLKVPYVKQKNGNSCGAAALEMVYGYYGITNIKQEEIFEKYKKLEPHGSGNFYITTDDLVSDAKERGFLSEIYRADYSNIQSVSSLKEILKQDVPIIVCQKYSKELPQIGHFRVVIGVDDKFVYLHDPDSRVGGESLKWTHQDFLDYWQPTGLNVTGGIFFVISKKKLF